MWTLGWVYFKLKNYPQALEFIKKSTDVRDSVEVLEHLGDVYEKLGEVELAVRNWQKAHDLDPERKSVLIKLGIN